MTDLSKASNRLLLLRLFIAMHIKTCIHLCGLLCSVLNVSGGHQYTSRNIYSAALSFLGLHYRLLCEKFFAATHYTHNKIYDEV